ncbi:MAG: xanthine dehydrogenase family protein molybdopterin-binding subunit [Alphaproteobacteria bacterium]
MGEFGIGQAVKRKEDDTLLIGKGRYIDDINVAGQAHAYVLRSPHANAKILSIDSADAQTMPGVLGIYVGADVEDIGPLPCAVDTMFEFKRRNGSKRFFPTHHVLARTHVRHVGDPVAFIVAENRLQAKDAAEAILVDYDILPSVTDTAAALAPDAPVIYSEQTDGNDAFLFTMGDAAAIDATFATAHRTVRFKHVNQRIIAASMEPRGCIGEYDAANDRYTLHTNTQSVYRNRAICAEMLGIEESQVHVTCPDVGGSFGMKGMPYPEQPLVMMAAKRLGRPVKWYSDRSEAFLSDTQGRDLVVDAELALDAGGHFLAVRVHSVGSMGAYASNFGPMILSAGSVRMLPGVYRVPQVYAEVEVSITNKVFTDAYRGAGRPEASYVIERLVDLAARELGLSPVEIRRRNLIAADQMPYSGPTGMTYDSGDFAKNLDDCLKAADFDGFLARRKASADRGKLRGIGMSVYIEATAGGVPETARIEVKADGSVMAYSGSLTQGQAHATTFAQIVADKLGTDYDRITVHQGDSDVLPQGGGAGGSRSGYSGGGAVLAGVEKVIDKARKIASHMLEAAEADIEFEGGTFRIAGTDRTLSLGEVAKAADDPANLPEGITPGLKEDATYKSDGSSYPNGCHLVEVEVDPDTGDIAIESYTVVDEFGVVLNPMIVHGQIHGGIVQGVGQALYEDAVYDTDSGQLLTGSFMDYCMPRALNMPSIKIDMNVVPCTTNSLGVKGAGEAGTTGSTGAVINAVLDALAPTGVKHIEMPATPQRVWRAIQDAKAA